MYIAILCISCIYQYYVYHVYIDINTFMQTSIIADQLPLTEQPQCDSLHWHFCSGN